MKPLVIPPNVIALLRDLDFEPALNLDSNKPLYLWKYNPTYRLTINTILVHQGNPGFGLPTAMELYVVAINGLTDYLINLTFLTVESMHQRILDALEENGFRALAMLRLKKLHALRS